MRVIDQHDFPVRFNDTIFDVRYRCNEFLFIFALEPLLNDLHMQESEKSPAESKAQRHGSFRFENQRCIVHAKFLQRIAKLGKIIRFTGYSPAKTIGFASLYPGNGPRGRSAFGNRIADLRIVNVSRSGNDITDISGRKFFRG